jgi:hypothetical protein
VKSQIKKLFRYTLYQNVLRHWVSHFRRTLINRLRFSNRGFRYHLDDDPSLLDLVLIKNYEGQDLLLGPVTQSFSCHKPDQRKALLSLSNAVIDPLSSYVFDSERRFIADFTSFSIDYAMNRFTMRPPKKISQFRPGKHLFIGSNTYYHWLIEELPAYLLARDHFPTATTLVHGMAPKYVFDALNMLNVQYEEIQKCTQVEELVFVSKSAALQPSHIDVSKLRETFAPWMLNSEGTKDHSRIYISRINQGRYPDNELKIQNLFTQYGFKIVDLVGFDLQDQIRLFSSAQVIAGTHGAGLSNFVWAPDNSVVLEILKWNHPKCYELLAQIRSQRYSRIEGKLSHWNVDLGHLESIVKTFSD